MKTVQLHEFIDKVADEAHCRGGFSFLCSAASKVYGRGGKYAMAKLLEESFPGRAYGEPSGFCWRHCLTDGIYQMHPDSCLTDGIYQMHPDNYFQTDRSILREQLIAKLLAQPDRTLVLPESFQCE